MNTRYETPRLAAEKAEPQSTTARTEGQALDEAQAEFRRAWQAKRQRADRLRERAENVERVEMWSARTAGLVILLAGCVTLVCWIGGANPGSALWRGARAVRYLWLACNLIFGFTWMTRMLLKRFADRLEAALVRYEAS